MTERTCATCGQNIPAVIRRLNAQRDSLRPWRVSYMVSIDGNPALCTDSLAAAMDLVYRNLGAPVALWRTRYTSAASGSWYAGHQSGDWYRRYGYAQPNRCIYSHNGGH